VRESQKRARDAETENLTQGGAVLRTLSTDLSRTSVEVAEAKMLAREHADATAALRLALSAWEKNEYESRPLALVAGGGAGRRGATSAQPPPPPPRSPAPAGGARSRLGTEGGAVVSAGRDVLTPRGGGAGGGGLNLSTSTIDPDTSYSSAVGDAPSFVAGGGLVAGRTPTSPPTPGTPTMSARGASGSAVRGGSGDALTSRHAPAIAAAAAPVGDDDAEEAALRHDALAGVSPIRDGGPFVGGGHTRPGADSDEDDGTTGRRRGGDRGAAPALPPPLDRAKLVMAPNDADFFVRLTSRPECLPHGDQLAKVAERCRDLSRDISVGLSAHDHRHTLVTSPDHAAAGTSGPDGAPGSKPPPPGVPVFPFPSALDLMHAQHTMMARPLPDADAVAQRVLRQRDAVFAGCLLTGLHEQAAKLLHGIAYDNARWLDTIASLARGRVRLVRRVSTSERSIAASERTASVAAAAATTMAAGLDEAALAGSGSVSTAATHSPMLQPGRRITPGTSAGDDDRASVSTTSTGGGGSGGGGFHPGGRGALAHAPMPAAAPAPAPPHTAVGSVPAARGGVRSAMPHTHAGSQAMSSSMPSGHGGIGPGVHGARGYGLAADVAAAGGVAGGSPGNPFAADMSPTSSSGSTPSPSGVGSLGAALRAGNGGHTRHATTGSMWGSGGDGRHMAPVAEEPSDGSLDRDRIALDLSGDTRWGGGGAGGSGGGGLSRTAAAPSRHAKPLRQHTLAAFPSPSTFAGSGSAPIAISGRGAGNPFADMPLERSGGGGAVGGSYEPLSPLSAGGGGGGGGVGGAAAGRSGLSRSVSTRITGVGVRGYGGGGGGSGSGPSGRGNPF